MIFLPVQYRVGPIQLFRHDQPDQLVREGEGREGHFELRPVQQATINTKGTPDQDNELAGTGIGPLLYEIGQLQGSMHFTIFIQRHQVILWL